MNEKIEMKTKAKHKTWLGRVRRTPWRPPRLSPGPSAPSSLSRLLTSNFYLLTSIFLLLCPLALLGQETKDPPPAGPGDALFMEGQRAYARGEDERAAKLLMAAARADWRCLAIMHDARYTRWLPAQPCSRVPALKRPESKGDPGPRALYRLGLMRKNKARERHGELAARRAGRYFFARTVEEFPQSYFASEASLVLIDDGRCLVDAGYPDCLALLIGAYEDWLVDFPESAKRPWVVKELAASYLALAAKYEQPSAWESPLLSELFRGRAVEMAGVIVEDHPRAVEAKWAQDFIARIKASGKPFSIVPQGALSKSNEAKD